MALDVDALRRETPGCGYRLHLNNAGAALMSRTTLDVMHDHLRLEAEIGGYEAAEVAGEAIADVHAALGQLVGGRAEEIALFDNSTHAWNAAFYSLPLGPGDKILTGRDEYGSSVLAYHQVARRTGAELVVIPDDEDGAIDLAALEAAIDERTKLIGLTWVPTSGGLVNPAAEVGRIARAADVLYLLDATQVVGQLPVDVAELGCDVLSGTGRKFLRGPRGTGFLWAGERALERLEPFVVEVGSGGFDDAGGLAWKPGAARFATWENNYVAQLGLGSAVRQALDLGLGAIAERATAMGSLLRDGLDAVPGVSTHDTGAERCAIVTARIDGVDSLAAAAELGRHGVNVSTTVPGHNTLDGRPHPVIRLSPHYFTTEDEVERAITLVATLAG